jgi:hypothetical protein
LFFLQNKTTKIKKKRIKNNFILPNSVRKHSIFFMILSIPKVVLYKLYFILRFTTITPDKKYYLYISPLYALLFRQDNQSSYHFYSIYTLQLGMYSRRQHKCIIFLTFLFSCQAKLCRNELIGPKLVIEIFHRNLSFLIFLCVFRTWTMD